MREGAQSPASDIDLEELGPTLRAEVALSSWARGRAARYRRELLELSDEISLRCTSWFIDVVTERSEVGIADRLIATMAHVVH